MALMLWHSTRCNLMLVPGRRLSLRCLGGGRDTEGSRSSIALKDS